jgi:hypothetical protein
MPGAAVIKKPLAFRCTIVCMQRALLSQHHAGRTTRGANAALEIS